MYQLEWRGEGTMHLDGDLVHHTARVMDSVKPKVFGHLLLSEIRAGHGTHGLPGPFGQGVLGLTPGRCAKDLRLVAVYPTTCAAPQQLLVTVAPELLGHPPSIRPEFLKGCNDVCRGQGTHAVEPHVLRGVVNQE